MYPGRGYPPPPPTAEAADAAAHYSDVFRSAFKEAGEHVSSAGQQLSEWLRAKQEASNAARNGEAAADDPPPGEPPPADPER